MIRFHSFVEDESQPQGAQKPKQNSQQPATENDQNAGAIGATSQSPIDTTNAQQSQDLVNNSQQHQVIELKMTVRSITKRFNSNHFPFNS